MNVTEENVNTLSMSTKAVREASKKDKLSKERRSSVLKLSMATSSSHKKLEKNDSLSSILKKKTVDESRQLHSGLA